MPDTSVMFKAWYEHSFELRESYGYGFGLLSLEDQEKMELILTERSDGSYGAPALHGILTASWLGLNQLQWIGYCKRY
jgi:hypothetical protein